MMKKLILTVAIVGLAAYTQAQGYVNFNTRTLGVTARIYDAGGTTPLSGTGFFAQIYAADGAGALESSMTAKGTAVNFGTGGGAGYVLTSAPAVPNVQVSATPGTVTLEVRAWSADGSRTGKSAPITVVSADPNAQPPGTPPFLTGLQGFTLTPEPSTIALGVLGLSALLFRRRK